MKQLTWRCVPIHPAVIKLYFSLILILELGRRGKRNKKRLRPRVTDSIRHDAASAAAANKRMLQIHTVRLADLWACWSSCQSHRASAGSYRRGTTCRWTSCSRPLDCRRHDGASSRSYCVASDSRPLYSHRTSPSSLNILNRLTT